MTSIMENVAITRLRDQNAALRRENIRLREQLALALDRLEKKVDQLEAEAAKTNPLSPKYIGCRCTCDDVVGWPV